MRTDAENGTNADWWWRGRPIAGLCGTNADKEGKTRSGKVRQIIYLTYKFNERKFWHHYRYFGRFIKELVLFACDPHSNVMVLAYVALA